MKKIMYITIGTISLGLAYVGVVMPFIPFTPFLLLTAFCYGRSSEKLDKWFKETKLYKENLESFIKGEGMTKKSKTKVMSMITILMAFGFIMMLGKAPMPALITLAVVWIGHMVYFLKFVKTKIEVKND